MTSELTTEELPAEQIARLAATIADSKNAADLRVLDLRGTASYTDFFVIASGGSDRQVKAIHDALHTTLKKDYRLIPRRVEGLAQARWVLMDYFDVIIHIFVPEMREFYRLEQLWGDVPRLALDGPDR